MVGKILSWVSTLQEPILKLVYLWYTNTEQNRKKDKTDSITHTRHLTFYIIYLLVALQGKNTQRCSMVELYKYCSMNKHHVKVVQNGKRLTWQVWVTYPGDLTISCQSHRCLYSSKNKGTQKKVENGFLWLS